MLIDKKRIASKIQETAAKIDGDYANKDLVLLMVLKGAVCTVADLMRALEIPCELQYVQCRSYGMKGKERSSLEIIGLDLLDLKDRDVLIVDDIFDSGNTIGSVSEALRAKHPRSIRSLTLLCKDIARSDLARPDYVLFEIPNFYVVGYGLDYKEKYRALPQIYALEGAE